MLFKLTQLAQVEVSKFEHVPEEVGRGEGGGGRLVNWQDNMAEMSGVTNGALLQGTSILPCACYQQYMIG